MKSWQKAAARLALSSLTAFLLSTTPARAGRHQNSDVTLVSFGSMQGELVTCGCHASPKGGLARRSAIIDSLVTAKNPFLHLELGDVSKIDDISGEIVDFGSRNFALDNTIAEDPEPATTPPASDSR
jgi:hypothetical protein